MSVQSPAGHRLRIVLAALTLFAGMASLGLVQSGTVRASSPTWTASTVPLPTGFPKDANVTIASTACPSTGDCFAAGSYYSGSSSSPVTGKGAIFTLSSSTWKVIKAPIPTGANIAPNLTLNAIACTASKSCVIGGSYVDSNGNTQGLIISNGGGATWHATEVPLPADAASNPSVSLTMAACPSSGSCALAGTYTNTSVQRGALVLTTSASNWTATQPPIVMPSNGSNAQATALACPTSGHCVVVGMSDFNFSGAAVATLSGTTWTETVIPALPNGSGGFLQSVSCSSASSCVAVGGSRGQNFQFSPLIVSGSGTKWKAIAGPLPKTTNTSSFISSELYSVSCPFATCVVLGSYPNAENLSQAMILTGSGTSWKVSATPTSSAIAGVFTTSGVNTGLDLACSSTSRCVASGEGFNSTGFGVPLLLSESGSGWSFSSFTLPLAGGTTQATSLNGVACHATVCAAVGEFFTASNYQQGLLLSATGSSWTSTRGPLPSDAGITEGVVPGGLSCSAVGKCMAVGVVSDPEIGPNAVVVDSLSSGTWTATRIKLPPDASILSAPAIGALTCSSSTSCVAVGSYQSTAVVEGLVLAETAGKWKSTRVPLPSALQSGLPFGSIHFVRVLCPAVNACVAGGEYDSDTGRFGGVLLTQSGSSGAWTLTQAPGISGSGTVSRVDDLACPSAGSCVAVADSPSSQSGFPNVYGFLTEKNGSWIPTRAPAPSGDFATVTGIVCQKSGSCTAIGSVSTSSGAIDPAAWTRSSGKWSVSLMKAPPNAFSNSLLSTGPLVCPSTTGCVAAATYLAATANNTPTTQNILGLSGAGTHWSQFNGALPGPTFATTAVDGMACTSMSSCVAVGTVQDDEGNSTSVDDAFLAVDTAGKWSSTVAPLPTPAADNSVTGLADVQCPSSTSCVAFGSYTASTGALVGVFETQG